MADPKKAAAPGVGTPLIAGGKKFWFLMFAIIGILALYHYFGRDFNTRSAGEAGSHSVTQVGTTDITGGPPVIRVTLDPKQWSSWQQVPLTFETLELDAPGCVEFQFLNGQYRKIAAHDAVNWKSFPCATFKMRGDPGVATIVIR